MAQKILVVDDEPDIRNTIKTVLEKEGFKVTTAKDADDALGKTKKEKFALILMDIMMPGTSVKEIVPKIKNSKIVFISVVRTSEAENKNLTNSKNIIGFIQKPFDIEDLVKKVKKFVKK